MHLGLTPRNSILACWTWKTSKLWWAKSTSTTPWWDHMRSGKGSLNLCLETIFRLLMNNLSQSSTVRGSSATRASVRDETVTRTSHLNRSIRVREAKEIPLMILVEWIPQVELHLSARASFRVSLRRVMPVLRSNNPLLSKREGKRTCQKFKRRKSH